MSDSAPDGVIDAEAYCSACNQSFDPSLERCPDDGARLIRFAASRDPLIGRVLDGRFEVREPLGRGGMGTVYRALQLSVDREVAVKVVHPKLAGDRQAAKRFLREARLSSRLAQPGVVQVIDFGQTEDGVLYLVMELLRGRTLASAQGGQPLPLRRAAAIALQLLDALVAAHAQGIVHRDLKPGNIVVLADPPGRDLIKVLDFGLAKSLAGDVSSGVTASDAILGTPLYMSPEQIQGRPTDGRSDLYAIGCILYELITGAPPFTGDAVNLILAHHLSDPPPPLPAEVPAPLAALVAALLAKRPEDRPASAEAVRATLQALIDAGLPGGGSPPRPALSPPAMPSAAHAETVDTDAAADRGVASTFDATGAAARPRRWRRWLAAGAVVAVAGAATVLATRGGSQRAGAVAPPDAAASAVAPVDAAAVDAPATLVDAGALDAAPPTDAPGTAADARRRELDRPGGARPPVDAGPPPPPPVDAAPRPRPPIDAPELDFYPR